LESALALRWGGWKFCLALEVEDRLALSQRLMEALRLQRRELMELEKQTVEKELLELMLAELDLAMLVEWLTRLCHWPGLSNRRSSASASEAENISQGSVLSKGGVHAAAARRVGCNLHLVFEVQSPSLLMTIFQTLGTRGPLNQAC